MKMATTNYPVLCELSDLKRAYEQVFRKLLADIDIRTLLPWFMLICLSGETYALSCAPPKLTEAVITNSDTVFEGVAGNKHGLTWQQKISAKIAGLTGRFAGVENLSVYDFTVTKNWKGVAAGQVVSVLFNTTWGDSYLPGSHYLIVSPRQVGEMYWTPLCGNSNDLEWARTNGDVALLEAVIGVGDHIKIVAEDRACESAQDCTAVSTHCGGCDCGTPVSVVAAGKYKQQLQNFCAIVGLTEHCEIVCETFVPSCHEGLCR